MKAREDPVRLFPAPTCTTAGTQCTPSCKQCRPCDAEQQSLEKFTQTSRSDSEPNNKEHTASVNKLKHEEIAEVKAVFSRCYGKSTKSNYRIITKPKGDTKNLKPLNRAKIFVNRACGMVKFRRLHKRLPQRHIVLTPTHEELQLRGVYVYRQPAINTTQFLPFTTWTHRTKTPLICRMPRNV